jgi:hypothetical protein
MTRPASELAHLFRALKAPAAARALPKLAERARADEWSFEQFAAALLKTEVDSRDSHAGQGRIKAARFPARKTLEEFDFSFQTSIRRDTVLHLGQLLVGAYAAATTTVPVGELWVACYRSAGAWPLFELRWRTRWRLGDGYGWPAALARASIPRRRAPTCDASSRRSPR